MAQFLTQAWFDELHALNATAGELNLPPTLDGLVINVSITGSDPVTLHLKNGKIAQNHTAGASSTVSIDRETLGNIIAQNSTEVAIEAFMTGKIRIDGDMSQVMTLQSAKPSAEQKALFKQIKEMTKF